MAFITRWTIETTFEESRAHLGFATPRQWSDQATERTTPWLLGLYSIGTLLAHALYPDGQLPVRATAWDPKAQATFADALASVRRQIWEHGSFSTSAQPPDLIEIPKAEFDRLIDPVCYAH